MIDLANLTKSLHTDRIAQIGLGESIHFELETINRTGLLDIEYSITGIEESLDDQKAIVLFRIFQENLNNILKHSKARKVQINLTYLDDKFIMKITDDGIGFNVVGKEKFHFVCGWCWIKEYFQQGKTYWS